MDIIIAPLIVWICVSGVYGLFELFVRRKERMVIIEKLNEKSDISFLTEKLGGQIGMPNYLRTSFSGLKIGCLLVGLGIGLLVGVFIAILINSYNYVHDYRTHEIYSIACAAPVLLFGGLGLLISFLIETKMNKKSKG